MTERSRRVVLLIDYDNLQICAARDTPGRDLQLVPVVQLAQRYGSVILARAYAEWNLSTERLAVYKAGIEPAFAPVLRTESDRSGKSLADTVMVAEGMDMLWTLAPEVVVLATSDKDLIPLVRVAKQRGAFVVVLGSDFTAIPLREMADEHVTYRQLITEPGVRYATEAGPGRQPAALPEPRRRRERERDGRERGTSDRATSERGTSERGTSERGTSERGASERGASAPSPATAASTATPAPSATPSSAAATAEPVAPVTSGTGIDADAQTSGRRRRRRGSRRRSDRLGLTGEGTYTGEGQESEDGVPPTPEDITPTTPAGSVDTEVSAATEPTEGLSETAAPEPPAVPRERRRRTTRRSTATPDPTVADEPEQGGLGPVTPTPEPPAQSADIMPAPRPDETSSNGTTTNGTTAEAEPAEGGEPEAGATPGRRPRRVASASRGRSRRP